MLPRIEAVGREVEKQWRRAKFSKDQFNKIAIEALQKSNLHQNLNINHAIERLSKLKRIPRQVNIYSRFGDPPLTVFGRKHFFIDLYFWLVPKTGIHSHSFRGAFTVLKGKSLHTRYRFSREKGYGEREEVWAGNLTRLRSELLKEGDIRPIEPGSDLIHQVCHLSFPSLSLVIRNRNEGANNAFVRTFIPPKIAFRGTNHYSQSAVRKRQILAFLAQTKNPQLKSFFQNIMKSASDMEAFSYLETLFSVLKDLGQFESVVLAKGTVRRKWYSAFVESFQYYNSKTPPVDFSKVRNESHRFLIALLGSVNREEIKGLVEEYAPGLPFSRSVMRWLTDLQKDSAIDFNINKTAKDILFCWIDGKNIQETCSLLSQKYSVENPKVLAEDVRVCRQNLAQISILKPLLHLNL